MAFICIAVREYRFDRRISETQSDRCGEYRLTFEQAWEFGIRLADKLLAFGPKPGDGVGVLEDNCAEAADFFLAGAIADIIRMPMYPRNGFYLTPPIELGDNIKR